MVCYMLLVVLSGFDAAADGDFRNSRFLKSLHECRPQRHPAGRHQQRSGPLQPRPIAGTQTATQFQANRRTTSIDGQFDTTANGRARAPGN